MDDTADILSPPQALDRAADIVGGQAAIGRLFGISRSAVCQWGQCPPERVIALERATGGLVTRYQLRPDIYPPEDAEGRQGASTEAA